MKIVNYNPDKIISAEYNPRELTKDQHKQLRDSITRFGLVDPLIVNTHKERKNILVGGHQRLKIAKELGFKEIPCVEVELTLDKEKELNVRLNKNTGQWDWDSLANYFDAGELLEWGFTEDELQFTEPEEVQGLTDDDDVPEVEEAITQQGDLWILGEHRLLCGDATKKEDVERLMDGQKADMVFTDPPYGIGYDYNSYNDKEGKEYLNFCELFWNVLKEFSELSIITTGWKYKEFWYSKNPYDEMVWFDNTKQSGGRAFHLRKSEPIFIFGKVNFKYKWDTFEIRANRNDGIRELHTCPKPIELINDLIIPQTKKESIILDIFLGSGSTLIACEKTNRKCYGLEIDPHYCDVIVKRWEDYTGNKAERFEAANA